MQLIKSLSEMESLHQNFPVNVNLHCKRGLSNCYENFTRYEASNSHNPIVLGTMYISFEMRLYSRNWC
jgi:hypothetical protein